MRAEERYLEALERHGLEDLRPACRALLRELREADATSYRRAVRRYENELVDEVAGGDADPVASWIQYGAWLADRLRAGTTMVVAPDGRARPLEEAAGDDGFPARRLFLHLPQEWRDRGRILAVPREPSEFQAATRELFS